MQCNRKKTICREIELHELNTSILQLQTPVTFLFGKPGVGKSHVLRDACDYMQQRKEFCGIVMMALNKVREVTVMRRLMRTLILKKCNLSSAKARK